MYTWCSSLIPLDFSSIPVPFLRIPEDSCRNGRGTVKYWCRRGTLINIWACFRWLLLLLWVFSFLCICMFYWCFEDRSTFFCGPTLQSYSSADSMKHTKHPQKQIRNSGTLQHACTSRAQTHSIDDNTAISIKNLNKTFKAQCSAPKGLWQPSQTWAWRYRKEESSSFLVQMGVSFPLASSTPSWQANSVLGDLQPSQSSAV